MARYWPPPGFDPASLPPHGPAQRRLFVVYNASATDTLYVAARADTPLAPELTGFPLAPGQTRVLELPPSVTSGRLWVRTGCRPAGQGPGGEALVVCDTGSCGRPATGGSGGYAGLDGTPTPVQCLTESAKTCASLIEFTLTQDTDTYDVSMVDGWNAPMLIVPIPGRFSKANPQRPDDQYDSTECGSVLPPGDAADVARWCPLEMQYPSFSGRKAMGCLNLCKALDRSDMDRVDDTTPLDLPDAPPDAPRPLTARKWLQLLATAPAWMHPKRTGARMRDIVCCQCGTVGECEGANGNWGCDPNGTCAPGIKPFAASLESCKGTCAPNSRPVDRTGAWWKDPAQTACLAGCTPYNNTYPASWSQRRCPVRRADGRPFDDVALAPQFAMTDLTSTPEWPRASNGENYPDVFKKRSPGAYSWQFDDHKSTFVTRGADFFVVVGIDDPPPDGPPPDGPPPDGPPPDGPPPDGPPPLPDEKKPWPWWAWLLLAVGLCLVVAAAVAAAVSVRRGHGRPLARRQGGPGAARRLGEPPNAPVRRWWP